MIDYWYYTGDTTYNQITQDALLFQVGPDRDYMPPNQTLTEGNDDQGFWGMAVMTAAEYKFPDPPADQPQWLALAQAVFNTQAARWDNQTCNGGLRWQIFNWNNGFDYKNSISQACFFNIAARLALYTGNSSYADWAVKTWDWMVYAQLMDENYYIFDGSHIVGSNCTSIVPYQFSYNPAAFLLGAAAMYAWSDQQNLTSDRDMWQERVDGVLNGTDVFFFSDNGSDPVMFEVACEGVGLCDTDQQSFKAYLSRWMAATTKWAPWTYDRIKSVLSSSAVAAATQCVGGSNGRMCGLKWANNSGAWDGTTGVGQQMAAMEVVLANMIQQADTPVTNSTGGTSVGNAGGGGSDIGRTSPVGSMVFAPLTTGDRAGAIICTIVICAGVLSTLVFLMSDENQSAGENWESFRTSLTKGPGAAVLVKGGRQSIIEEKGKGIVHDGSSSESGEPIPRAGGISAVTVPDRVRQPDRTARFGPEVSAPDRRGDRLSIPSRGTRRSLQKRDKRLTA
jgi:mannan endo-1,6-alpha-mannosidase